MPLVVGVDAGGSATVAVSERDGVVLRTAIGEPANPRVRGVDAAAAAIANTIEEVLRGERASAIHIGAAGAADAGVAAALREALISRLPHARVGISDDARIALRAGLPLGDGIALLAGTGSIVYAEIGEQSFRVGGHGALLGDDGSGFSIGAAALRLLLRSYDGRTSRTELLERIERHFGVHDASALLARVYSAQSPVAEIATAAPLVVATASEGERSATKIVQSAALELAESVRALVRHANVEDRALPLLFAGGLLRENTLLTFLLETRLTNELPHLQIVKGSPEPQFGALAVARALLES